MDKTLTLIKRQGSFELRKRRSRNLQTCPATRRPERLCLGQEAKAQSLGAVLRANVEFRYGAESTLGVKAIALTQA